MPSLSRDTLAARLVALPARADVRSSALVEWAREAIDDAIDAAGVEVIVTTAQSLYDQHVAPVDVPWVPDPLEPALVDAPAKWFLGQLIRGFHARIHTEG